MDSKELRLIKEAYAGIQEGYGKKEEKEEKEEGCVPKSEKGEHNCAKKVCHEQFGEGQCIFGEHAEPDENGFVSHYDVLFGHGVEKNVPVSEMEVLFSESHGGHGKKKTMMAHYEVEGELVDEGMGLSLAASRIGGALGSNPRTSAEQGAKNLQKNLTDPIGFAVKGAAKGAFKAVGDFIGSGMPNNRPQTPLQKNVARKTQEVLNREDVDLFDIVKGYLMSEGYADTEEAALAIMANMSEEWRQSILSEDPVQDYRDRRRAEENRAGLRGPELSHASDKTTQPAGGPSKKTPSPTSPKTPSPTSPKTPSPTSPKTPNAGTNKPNSSVSSPGFDTRRIGGYDLRRLP